MNKNNFPTNEEYDALLSAYSNCRLTIRSNIYKIIPNSSYIDDCEQDTLLFAIQNIDKFIASENPEGWLFHASTYAAYRLIRREKLNSQNIPIDDISVAITYNFSERIADPFGRIKMINLIRKHLPRASGDFLLLVLKHNKSNKELAEILGISESAVRSRWKRLVDDIYSLPIKIIEKFDLI